jgi:hypothetical protein
MKELLNKKIHDIYIDVKNNLLKFIVEDELASIKELIYQVEGDCCSESWWSEIIGYSNLKGWKDELLKVTNVINLKLGKTDKLSNNM